MRVVLSVQQKKSSLISNVRIPNCFNEVFMDKVNSNPAVTLILSKFNVHSKMMTLFRLNKSVSLDMDLTYSTFLGSKEQ